MPTIEELEKLIADEEGSAIEILPNGEVRYTDRKKRDEKPELVTPRDDVGNNY